MSIWFSSDLHLSHNKIQKFCPKTRRGETVEEMNELIIQEHNKRVKPTDRWYHLGDFSFASSDKTFEYLSRMNGIKYFLRGNHDKKLDMPQFRSQLQGYGDYRTMHTGSHRFVLMHYPIECWDRAHYGTIHLHGHVHGNTSNGECMLINNRMDVGIDNRDDNLMAPWHLDEVLDWIKKHKV